MNTNFKLLLIFTLWFNGLFCQIQLASNDPIATKKLTEYLAKSDSCKINFEYSTAFTYITKVLNYAEVEKDLNLEIYCHIRLIELFRHARLFQKSESYAIKTAQLIHRNNSKVSQSNLMQFYNRKAALFSEYYMQPDSTLHYSLKALNLSHSLKNSQIQFASLMEIGFVYENKLLLTKALNYYQHSYKIAGQNNIKLEKCNALINISRVYAKLNQPEMALQKCDEGLALLNDNDFFQKLMFYDTKQAVYEKMGEKSEAYESIKKRLKYTEYYYNKQAQDKLSEANKYYELLKKDQEIIQVQQDIAKAKQERWMLITILLLSSIVIFSLLYYSQKIKRVNKQLAIFSRENAFLLNEANHRINNNLQLIIILINEELEKNETQNIEGFSMKKILIKVDSIATLHRHLYQSTNKKTVNIAEYLEEIRVNFSEIFADKEIHINYCVEPIDLPIDVSMYLGLITTELLTNSQKHAFEDTQTKTIDLSLQQNQKMLYLNYKDNGTKSIGKKIKPNLITLMCKQIKADYTIQTTTGFEMQITKDLNKTNDKQH